MLPEMAKPVIQMVVRVLSAGVNKTLGAHALNLLCRDNWYHTNGGRPTSSSIAGISTIQRPEHYGGQCRRQSHFIR